MKMQHWTVAEMMDLDLVLVTVNANTRISHFEFKEFDKAFLQPMKKEL